MDSNKKYTIEEFKKEIIEKYPFLHIYDNNIHDKDVKIVGIGNNDLWFISFPHKGFLLCHQLSKPILENSVRHEHILDDESLKKLKTMFTFENYRYLFGDLILLQDRYYDEIFRVKLSLDENDFWSKIKGIFEAHIYDFSRNLSMFLQQKLDILVNTNNDLIKLQQVLPISLKSDLNNQLKVLIEHFKYLPDSSSAKEAEKHFNSFK